MSFGGLNAFADDGHPQEVRELDDRGRDRFGLGDVLDRMREARILEEVAQQQEVDVCGPGGWFPGGGSRWLEADCEVWPENGRDVAWPDQGPHGSGS